MHNAKQTDGQIVFTLMENLTLTRISDSVNLGFGVF